MSRTTSSPRSATSSRCTRSLSPVRVGARLENLLTGELQAAPAAEIERTGRKTLGTLAVKAAETWRQQQAQLLEEGLARLGERLAAQLQTELDQVREAAAELLGLHLAVPAPAEHLAPDMRFFYLVAEEPGDRAAGRDHPAASARRGGQAPGPRLPAPGGLRPGSPADRTGPAAAGLRSCGAGVRASDRQPGQVAWRQSDDALT
jgi:hypothetical protein